MTRVYREPVVDEDAGMDLHLRLSDDGGLAEQIYAQIDERIRDGVLPTGTVLPSCSSSTTCAS